MKKIFFLIFLLSLFFLPKQTQAMSIASSTLYTTSSIRAYWPLDTTANDMLGVYSGTATNVTWSTGVEKYNGNALDLTNNSYISFPDGAGLIPKTNYAISTWLYPMTTSSDLQVMGRMKQSASYDGWYLRYFTATQNLKLYINNVVQITTPTSSVPYDQWTNVIVQTQNDVTSIYLNGVAVSTTYAGKLPNYATNLLMGVALVGQPTFYGRFDDSAVWDHFLGATEIAEIQANWSTPSSTPTIIIDPREYGIQNTLLLILVGILGLDLIRRIFKLQDKKYD